MIGLPGDTSEGFRETMEFVKNLDLARDAQVFKTQILPGTALRKQAQRFGIEYEQRPPYQVIATPQWRRDELDESLYDAEEVLGTHCTPDESPILLCSRNKKSDTAQFNTTKITYAYYFDCSLQQGRERFLNETFKNTSFTVSLVCKITDLNQLEAVKMGVSSFYQANPFSSSVVGFEIPPGFPLDLFDIVNSLKSQNKYSSYIESLYPTANSSTPHRRTIACLKVADSQHCSGDWLYELRAVAEVLWIAPVSIVSDGRLETNRCIEEIDFVHIDNGVNPVTHDQLQWLSTTALKHQIVFPDVETQWRFVEMRNKSDS
jgi:hypothetical protein